MGDERHDDRVRDAIRFCQLAYNLPPSWFDLSNDHRKPTRLPLTSAAEADRRSRVTLTFAQSSDGKIAGAGKKMLALSSAESMVMTHTLRILHHGILVGIGTLRNDDPQLNARLLTPLLDGSTDVPIDWLPRPIVLDGHLQTPLDCKLLKNAQAGRGRAPLIVTSTSSANSQKASALRDAGADLVDVKSDASGKLLWPDILIALRQEHNIQSLMIEGGATVIDGLFSEYDRGRPMIDDLIVTVSPMHVGESGLAYTMPAWLANEIGSSSSQNVLRHKFNEDVVLAWSLTGSA